MRRPSELYSSSYPIRLIASIWLIVFFLHFFLQKSCGMYFCNVWSHFHIQINDKRNIKPNEQRIYYKYSAVGTLITGKKSAVKTSLHLVRMWSAVSFACLISRFAAWSLIWDWMSNCSEAIIWLDAVTTVFCTHWFKWCHNNLFRSTVELYINTEMIE